MMHRNAKRPTKAEAARMARLKAMPCVACVTESIPQFEPTEVHHLLSGNRRRGHMFTIPLCAWHHRGIPGARSAFPDTPALLRCFGPSLARSSKAFHAAFGTDDELLERTNKLLEQQ